MKKTDIAMIVLIAGVSVLISYFLMQTLLGDPSQKTRKVETMEAVSSEYIEPSKDIFNDKAINPTVKIVIDKNGEQY